MRALTTEQARLFEVVARRIVPGLDGLGPDGRERFRRIVDAALMERPPAVRRQFGVLLAVIRWLPVFRWGRRFERLSEGRQDRVLRSLQDAPVGKLRAGFWGLKTLVFMGYYGQPETWLELPYRPGSAGGGASAHA